MKPLVSCGSKIAKTIRAYLEVKIRLRWFAEQFRHIDALQSCGINVRGVRGLVARRDRLQRAGSRLEERLGLSWSAGQDTGDT